MSLSDFLVVFAAGVVAGVVAFVAGYFVGRRSRRPLSVEPNYATLRATLLREDRSATRAELPPDMPQRRTRPFSVEAADRAQEGAR